MLGLTLSKSATGGKAWASPYKSQHKSDNNSEAGRYEKEEKEDTKALLKKTEETVEEMKRSCTDNVQTVSLIVIQPLLAFAKSSFIQTVHHKMSTPLQYGFYKHFVSPRKRKEQGRG
jgi:uncharacterized membrane protein